MTMNLVLQGPGATQSDLQRIAALALVGLLLWFAVMLQVGTAVGLVERILTAAEALWPIVVVQATPRLVAAQR